MKKLVPNKISDEDLEMTKLRRESALNPRSEPGLSDNDDDDLDSWGSFDDDDDWGGDSTFGESLGDSFGGGFGSGGFGSGGFGGGGFGDGFGGGLNGGFGGFGMQQQQQNPDNVEDKFFEAIIKGGKGSFNFFKELVESTRDFSVYNRMEWGRGTIITGGIVSLLSLIMMLMGIKGMLHYLVGGLLSVGLGVPIFMFALADIQENPQSEVETESEVDFSSDFGDEEELSSFEEDEGFDFGNDFFEDEEEDLFPSAFEGDEFQEESVEVEVDPTSVLKELNANMGMVTRQYLYELETAVLKHKNKKFSDVKVLPEDSREFLTFANIIESAAENLRKANDESMPQLLSVKDKLFYTQLEISRVKWIKSLDPLIEEIVNICRFDEDTGTIDENIFGYGYIVGDKMYIKIMKGETAIITLKDAYDKVSKEILDTANYLPVVFGINEEGEVVWRDLKHINSMLVTGMPRSGKSWFVKAILAQMMMFMSPRDLHFYLLDPKADISDFKSLNVPHVRKFVSSDEDILRELRWVVKTEADRRRKVMKEAGGFIDFWDLKKKRPDIDMPLLYVVIDEVVTLAERMDKETKAEFQGLLTQLVSQLPALGIRILMVPHVIKDQVLKKTITDLIPCRISVMGDPSHIESTTGTKPSQFIHKLSKQGDMAVRLGNEKTHFVHGVIIADSNEGIDDYFEFLRNMWLKINPDYIKGSKYEREVKGIDDDYTEDNEEDEKPVKRPTRQKKSSTSTKKSSKSKKKEEETEVEDLEFDIEDLDIEIDLFN